MGFYSDVIFPATLDWLLKHGAIEARRTEVLSQVCGAVLEIGGGTGLNLDHYPDELRKLTVIEPNAGMQKEFMKKANGHRLQTDFHLCGAEKMPFANESFDSVVSTITLCSIPKLHESLLEIRRVLRPQGQFIFLDHGLSADKSIARIQNLFNPIQKVIGAGCQIIVPVDEEIRKAGFQIKTCKKYYAEKSPKFIGYFYEGVAAKIDGLID